MSRVVPKEYYQYMSELQALDFVLVELTLYLDTHPDDQATIAQFSQFQHRRASIMQQFEAAFGPLRHYGASSIGKNWTWSDGPWPWQV